MQRTKVICPECGIEISKSNFSKHQRRHLDHPESFVSGKYTLNHEGLVCQFCGKECKNRNSLCNHERLCKLNPNRQESVGFTKFNAAREAGLVTSWNTGLTKDTDERVKKSAKSISKYYETHSGSWTGRTHTEEQKQKISRSRKQYLLEHPDQVPYLLNHSSQESYPEIYFTELFKNEEINLHKEYYCLGYFLDFCDPIKKIDIEIDGEQHCVDSKIVEHDKIRNAVLEKAGWTIFRVRWAEYKTMTEEQKHNIILQIKSLLA
jgi:very-short-patch-repair endonuclease